MCLLLQYQLVQLLQKKHMYIILEMSPFGKISFNQQQNCDVIGERPTIENFVFAAPLSVADPGFPRPRRQPQCGGRQPNFWLNGSRKFHENERNWTREHSWHILDPPMVVAPETIKDNAAYDENWKHPQYS